MVPSFPEPDSDRTASVENSISVIARGEMWRINPDLLGVINSDGYFEASNPAWSAVLGWSEEEVASTYFFDFVHPDDIAPTQAAWVDLIDRHLPVLRFENRYRHKEGGWRWISWVAVPEDDKVYCSARDVTHEKAQASGLAAAENALRQSQKMEALGQLTSGIAHDFNNILAAITGGLSAIERKSDDEFVIMVATHCKTAAFRGAKIVRQMLAFARQEVLAPTSVDLLGLMEEVEPLIRQAIPGNIITFEFPADLPSVRIDAALLEAALLNLAGNANDAMPGGGALSFSARLSSDGDIDRPIELASGDAVVLSVRDTGTGMPHDVLHKIIEPFYTTKETGRGTGLGLAMVQGFIIQSGGGLRIESEVGHGTTVYLYLPCSDADDDKVTAEIPSPLVQRDRGSILLVDDDAHLRPMIALQLRNLGFLVTEAVDSKTALEHIDADTTIDIVLTDVVMAGGDGITFAHAARQRRPHTPILFMTGNVESKRLDGETVIYKPFEDAELMQMLEQLLDDATRARPIDGTSDNKITLNPTTSSAQ